MHNIVNVTGFWICQVEELGEINNFLPFEPPSTLQKSVGNIINNKLGISAVGMYCPPNIALKNNLWLINTHLDNRKRAGVSRGYLAHILVPDPNRFRPDEAGRISIFVIVTVPSSSCFTVSGFTIFDFALFFILWVGCCSFVNSMYFFNSSTAVKNTSNSLLLYRYMFHSVSTQVSLKWVHMSW